MDPISNVDRLVLLLRQRLAERGNAARGGPAVRSAVSATRTSALQKLAGVEGVDERHLRRALIQNLLSESLGEKLTGDAQFQQVVDRVTQTMEGDPEVGKLLHRMVRELKEAAR
jgi:hypothetical protein